MSTPKPIGPPQAAPPPPRGVPVSPAAAFPVAAQAAPIAVQPPRPRFRCREYTMLQIMVVVLHMFAGLSALDFAASVWLVFSTLLTTPENARIGIAVLLLSAVFHLLWAAFSMVLAELIRVALDVQRNTQETAFNSRRIG